jgi:long-chain acyl-CoA synthetase
MVANSITLPLPFQPALPIDVPTPDRLVDILRQRHQEHLAKTAFIERNQLISYAELWERVDAMQASFDHSLIGPGEVIALCSPNSLALCVAFLAALQHGAVPFVVNYKLEVLGDLSVLNIRHYLMSKGNTAGRRYFKDVPYVEENTFDANFDLYQNPYAALDPLDNTALLVTSSGSSGQPKVVRLTDSGTLANIRANVRALHLHSDDVTAIGLPLGYAYGLVGQLLSHLYVGATVLLLDSLFFLPSITQAVSRYQVTTLFMVPPMVRQINYLRSQGQFKGNFSSLRFVAVGGNRIESSAIQRAIDLFGCPIVKTYGLAEAGPRVATNPVTDCKATTVDSVGRPNHGVQIDILDECGHLLPPYQAGIIRVVSPSVTVGYFNVSDNGKIEPGISVTTKDIGYLDSAGHLFILGRNGDQFTLGGRQYWFRQVENVLYAHFSFLKVSLQLTTEGVLISAVMMRSYAFDPAEAAQRLRDAFGPEADQVFTLELVQTNTMLNDK